MPVLLIHRANHLQGPIRRRYIGHHGSSPGHVLPFRSDCPSRVYCPLDSLLHPTRSGCLGGRRCPLCESDHSLIDRLSPLHEVALFGSSNHLICSSGSPTRS
uniref:Uncharacterized protein n=2 Tax=environmental samples TaxID=68359 RepID=A0A075HVV7_9EURY|nr:hypothetical protein [uncultured marine group II/III euryarchaeote KM3_31_G10]AIF19854.1 hypothetical protein [uncultured marine group II/III euryarchaeote KM3_87_G11]